MRQRALFVAFLSALVLLMACSDHEIQPFQPGQANGRVIGSIHGVIMDYCTKLHMDSSEVEVTWIVGGQQRTTTCNSLGYYSITNLTPGDYVLTFQTVEETHAIGRWEVHIPTLEDLDEEDVATNEDYQYSRTANVALYGLNSNVTGTIYKQDDALNFSLATGVTVELDYRDISIDYESFGSTEGWGDEGDGNPYNDQYYVFPVKYVTTTDANGVFTFTNMPGAEMARWTTLSYVSGGITYASTHGSVDLEQNNTYNIGTIRLAVNSDALFLVSNNFDSVENFALDANMTATFSKVMDPTTVSVEFFYYKFDNQHEDIEIDTTWTNNRTLTINPRVPNLLAGTTYYLAIEGTSVDGNDFDEGYMFNTIPGIEFLETNLERAQDVYDEFPIASNITFDFSLPIDLSHPNTFIAIFDEAAAELDINYSLNTAGTQLIINPTGDLEPGQDYRAMITVYSELPGDFETVTIDFTTASAITAPGQVTGLTHDEGSGWTANWNTTSIDLRWNSVTGATRYVIFAKDDNANTDYVKLDEITADGGSSIQYGTANLLSQFDGRIADGGTPFDEGTIVTFYVRAWNTAGYGPLSAGYAIQDQTDPALTAHTQAGGAADNTGNTSARTLTIQVDANEFVGDASTVDVTIRNTDNVAVVVTTTAVKHSDNMGYTISIRVDANADMTGYTVEVDAEDTSGNEGSSNIFTLI